jgi:hypothetical protein
MDGSSVQPSTLSLDRGWKHDPDQGQQIISYCDPIAGIRKGFLETMLGAASQNINARISHRRSY